MSPPLPNSSPHNPPTVLGYVLSDPGGRHQRDPAFPTPEAARAAVRGQRGWRVGVVTADGAIRFDDALVARP